VPFAPELLSERPATLLLAPDFFCSFIPILLHAILQVSCQIALQFFLSEKSHCFTRSEAIAECYQIHTAGHPR
jgi:hypothetical protein